MSKISFKWQMALICAIPFLFYTLLSVQNASQSYFVSEKSNEAYEDILFVEAISKLIHESQTERGKSAGYLNKGIELAELETQRKLTNEALKVLNSKTPLSSVSLQLKSGLEKLTTTYTTLRQQISDRTISTPDAIKSYTQIITALLKTELDFANSIEIAEVKSALYSMGVIEEAKESAGKLRANMTAILTKNLPITEDQFSTLVNLKGRVDANLYSPALVTSPEAKQLIEQFGSSDGWAEVNKVYKLILTKSELGEFNSDPQSFFKTITGVINHISKIAENQVQFAIVKARSNKTVASEKFWIIVSLLVFSFVGLSWISTVIINRINSVICEITEQLQKGSEDMAKAAEIIASSSVELSEAANEQAAALQETVTAIDEINAMVGRNAESASASKELSHQNQNITSSGKETMDSMIQIIQRINYSSKEIIDQVKESNTSLTDIMRVISEIELKTKVIHDIVFQTKLLSFNASVEAARAGEHGKGFAIVALEIGNLAQMSGHAAQEISALMDGKAIWVEKVLKETSEKMTKILERNEVEVSTGTITAKKCRVSLDEILQNADSVSSMVNEIALASGEQAKGVSEVTKAMQELDQVTQQNSSAALQASTSASRLSDQAENLKAVVDKLITLVEGDKVQKSTWS